jgi:hypothetical protein
LARLIAGLLLLLLLIAPLRVFAGRLTLRIDALRAESREQRDESC